MGGCRLLYFVKSTCKNGTKCVVLLCFYVNTFILLYFLRWQEGGATAPLATPLNPPLHTKLNNTCRYVAIWYEAKPSVIQMRLL